MPLKPAISFDQFSALDLRVGKIVDCTGVEESDKLLKCTVDIGTSKRQILAGVKSWFAPEDLVGQTVVVIANLEPKKMAGLASYGMILMADERDHPVLIAPTREVKTGTIVR